MNFDIRGTEGQIIVGAAAVAAMTVWGLKIVRDFKDAGPWLTKPISKSIASPLASSELRAADAEIDRELIEMSRWVDSLPNANGPC